MFSSALPLEASKFGSLSGTAFLPASTLRISRARSLCTPPKAVAMSESTIKIYDASSLTAQQLKEITARPRIDFTSILGTVREDGCLTCVFTPLPAAPAHTVPNPP